MSKEKTKKQLQIQAGKLLRGIDNSTNIISNHQLKLKSAVPLLRSAMEALNKMDEEVSSTVGVKPVTKQSKKAKFKPAKKPTQIKAKKEPSAVIKDVSADKKTSKKKAAVSAKETGVKKVKRKKAPVKDRPKLQDAVCEFLKGSKKVKRSDLYKSVTGKYGYWSSTSFSKTLKNESVFKIEENNIISMV